MQIDKNMNLQSGETHYLVVLRFPLESSKKNGHFNLVPIRNKIWNIFREEDDASSQAQVDSCQFEFELHIVIHYQ
jgi:hypothetical protein